MNRSIFTYSGQRWLLSELAAVTGVPSTTIRKRLARGWTLEQSVTTPTPKQRRTGIVSHLDTLKDAKP